ncbi:hypothetical protein [Gudongella sp. DL1XJH-153]|uniref:hypothetical protein n=1 Tax=Gudongella sp. DL1XJH-153 TaxID=3409804 RepID=UPI003BB7754E
MKKRSVLAFLITLIAAITVFYPRNLIAIIGEEPVVDENVNLSIIFRNTFEESGERMESQNQHHSEEIMEFLNSYKYRRSNKSYDKLDDLKSYSITIKDTKDEQLLRATIRGDEYISIMDKRDNYSLYKVWGSEFDEEFLANFYNSLNDM